MLDTEQLPRLWGWDQWVEEEVMPFLDTAAAGGAGPALWMIAGPVESGLSEALEVLGERILENPLGGRAQIVRMERALSESAYEWQARAALLLRQPSEALVAAHPVAESIPEDTGMAMDPEHEAPTEGPIYWIFSRGDTLPAQWWRRELRDWVMRNPSATLIVGSDHPSGTVMDAFRAAGGSLNRCFQRVLGPWDLAKVESWRQQFLSHDGRSAEELVRYSRGGWPGLLWPLYEERQKHSTTAASRQYIARTVGAMSPGERALLLAASTAPAPARDYAEILLDRQIAEAQWDAVLRHWSRCGLIASGTWSSDNLPRLLREACRNEGVEGEVHAERLKGLQGFHSAVPGEALRRLLIPLRLVKRFDRAVLEMLLGPAGLRLWEMLDALPALWEPANGGLRLLKPNLRRLLLSYVAWQPWALGVELEDRVQAFWEQQRQAMNDDINELEEKRLRLVEEAKQRRAELQGQERSLRRLQGAKFAPLIPPRRRSDHPRQLAGIAGIFSGVGWMYFNMITSARLDLLPILGGCGLILAGISAVWQAAEAKVEPTAAAVAARSRLDEERRRQLIRTQAQMALTREAHESLYTQIGEIKSRVARLDERLSMPLPADD